jgi:ABC-2 type transport system ATP-binding protein
MPKSCKLAILKPPKVALFKLAKLALFISPLTLFALSTQNRKRKIGFEKPLRFIREKTKMSMIEVEGLTKCFGQFIAVDHVSFAVEESEIFGFLGPNGAGKTTTIRMLCTLLRPTEGSARVAGCDIVKEQGKVREHIGLVAEKIILYDQLTAAENLILFGRLNNLTENEIRQQIDRWLSRLHMEQWRDHQVGTFSTGMKQRINIARALLHHPDVLFLDEPTLGLDPQTTRAIHEFLLELSREGITIVLTTHDMAEAELLCRRIAIIDKARIAATDTTANLKKLLSGGDTGVIDIEISNLNQELLSLLRGVSAVVSLTQTDTYRVRLHTRGDNAVSVIVSAIISAGGQIRAINTVEPNLEDVFLHLTGREMRDEASEKVPSSRGHFWRRRSSRVR